MKGLARVLFVGFGFLFVTIYTQEEALEDVLVDRAYHLAPYDGVTQQHHHPFAFTASPLGDLFRFSSFLSGELHAALHDQEARNIFLTHIDRLYKRSLHGYVLYCLAHQEITQQLTNMPEKRGYLLEELAHLRDRLIAVIEDLYYLIGDWENRYAIASRMNLEEIIKKIEEDFFTL